MSVKKLRLSAVVENAVVPEVAAALRFVAVYDWKPSVL